MVEPLDLTSMLPWLLLTSVVGALLLAFGAAVKGDRITRRLLLAWANQGAYRTLRQELTAVESRVLYVMFFVCMLLDQWWGLLVLVAYVSGACIRAGIRRNLSAAGEMPGRLSETER